MKNLHVYVRPSRLAGELNWTELSTYIKIKKINRTKKWNTEMNERKMITFTKIKQIKQKVKTFVE